MVQRKDVHNFGACFAQSRIEIKWIEILISHYKITKIIVQSGMFLCPIAHTFICEFAHKDCQGKASQNSEISYLAE